MEQRGFDSVWMSHVLALDAITALAVAGYETSRIELGTVVTISYPRHPTALALGLSHKMLIEDKLGLSYDRPAQHMGKYLEVLRPLLNLSEVDFTGELYRADIALEVPNTLENQTIPALLQCAKESGNSVEPRVVAGFPIVLASDVEGAKQLLCFSAGLS